MIQRNVRTICQSLVCAGSLMAMAAAAQAGTDRYGGVWNEGEASGPFVPLETGMSFNDVQSYMSSWEEFRITDLELVVRGCPAEEKDLFASQWEKGDWKDVLDVYGSLSEFSSQLSARCSEGFKLVDFEVWRSVCRESGERYLALYSDAEGCDNELDPAIHSSSTAEFADIVDGQNEAGYELVDFETVEAQNPSSMLGVFYPGNAQQQFGIYDRPSFEAEMLDGDGERQLIDMESYRAQPWWPRDTQWTRQVAGLWNFEDDVRDDHEVGEIFPKFEQLLFKDWSSRRLVDFEVYPNTWDRRFDQVFDAYLGSDPVGWGLSVRQEGEEVGSSGGGLATRPDPGQGLNAIPMTASTRGVTASVTKFVTAVGVIAYAETQTPANQPDWLDQPIVDILPADFVNLDAGVELLTPRDFLMQRTGLANFATTTNPATDSATYRGEMVAWLQQPVMAIKPQAPALLPFNYQNAHFDLLALTMTELVEAEYPNSQDPWRDWVNAHVLSQVGIGARHCGWTPGDARSYPFAWSMANFTWMATNYPCSGYGTGAAMWFLSADDLARLLHGVRSATILSQAHAQEVLDEGLGLDHWGWASAAYVPAQDTTPGTLGETFHSKNGGLGYWVGSELVGTETLVVTYDDVNFDDDSLNLSEYSYELGHTGFDIGITIHASSVASNDPCLPEAANCDVTRLYPSPMTMIQEAFRMPEDW